MNEAITRAAAAVHRPRGWQSRLAHQLGVERNTVSMWVRGKATPGRMHWPAIEAELGIDPGRLATLAAGHFGARQPDEVDGLRTALAALGAAVDIVVEDADGSRSVLDADEAASVAHPTSARVRAILKQLDGRFALVSIVDLGTMTGDEESLPMAAGTTSGRAPSGRGATTRFANPGEQGPHLEGG